MSDKEWEDIKRAVADCPFLILDFYDRVMLRIDNINSKMLVDFKYGGYRINDIFTGFERWVSRFHAVEFIQRLLLLPPPTYPQITINKGIRQGNYHRVTSASWSLFMCDGYLLMSTDHHTRLFALGDLVTIFGKTFQYDVHTFEGVIKEYLV